MTTTVKDKPAVAPTVIDELRDLNKQATRVNARMSELSTANTEDLNRIQAIKEARAQAEVAAVRAGEPFDGGPFDAETAACREAIAGRETSSLRRGLDQLRAERTQLIARRRGELVNLALGRVADADDALAAARDAILELQRQTGQMRGAMSLALEGLDPITDPLVRRLRAMARPFVAEPRRPIALDGMRSVPDVVAELLTLAAAAERELAARPPLEDAAAEDAAA